MGLTAAGAQAFQEYYSQVEAAYDSAAARLGPMFGMGPAGSRAKAAALQEIRSRIAAPARLLDIGCDIGFESLALAKHGYAVLGIDVSSRMVALAEERRATGDVSPLQCQFRKLRAANVGELAKEGRSFDAAYSVYGALNLEPRLGDAVHGLSRLLPPGAPLIVGALNPTVLYELAVNPFLLRFQGFRKAAQRPVRMRIGRDAPESVDCFLYAPGELARRFLPAFRLVRCVGLHVFSPPAIPSVLRFPRLLRAATALENRIGGKAPWNRLGYFSLLTFERTEADPSARPEGVSQGLIR